jgi:hypothetical protein
MYSSHGIRLACLSAVLGLVAGALAASASSSRANGFTLAVAAPSKVVVGQPTVIQVTGSVGDLRYPSWLTVVSIRPEVTSCPANYYEGKQIANATGGSILVSTGRITPDSSGNFQVPVGINPYLPGKVWICAYIHDGETVTLAATSLMLTISPKGSSGGPPASIVPPRITRIPGFLGCSRGQWSNQPTRFAYTWFVAGRRVGGGQRLRASGTLRGRTVRCRVIASNGAGSAGASSRPVVVR